MGAKQTKKSSPARIHRDGIFNKPAEGPAIPNAPARSGKFFVLIPPSYLPTFPKRKP